MKTPVDPAELPEASAADPPENHFLEAHCPGCGHTVDACCPKCGKHVEPDGSGLRTQDSGQFVSALPRAEYYRRLVLLLQSARNTKFRLCCYLIATGDGFADGVSMQDLATEWGVGKAVVSKECKIICAYLGIPPSPYMRRAETKDSYRAANRRPRKLT